MNKIYINIAQPGRSFGAKTNQLCVLSCLFSGVNVNTEVLFSMC